MSTPRPLLAGLAAGALFLVGCASSADEVAEQDSTTVTTEVLETDEASASPSTTEFDVVTTIQRLPSDE